MAPERTASKAKPRAPKHQRPARKARPVPSVQERLQKAWRSIKDQVQDGYPEHALKSVNKLLQLDPSNHLGKQTQLQLLLSLDRYRETLEIIAASENAGDHRIEQCYALYKLGRMEEAQNVLDAVRAEQGDADEGTQRTLDVLDAQIKYRLEQFEDAQLLYEDLLASAETDSPEHADLSTNLSAVNAQLDFISSVPSLLGDIQSSSKPLPSIEHLENTPVAPLVSSHRAYRARVTNAVAPTAEPSASTSASTFAPSTAAKGKRAKKQPKKDAPAKTKKVKLPPSIAALPEDKRPAPDPERWLPKRERSGFAEQMAQKQKEKEKQRLKARKKMEAALTQGAAADEGATPSAAQGQTAGRGQQQQQQQGKGQQQQQQQKKKKGKK